MKVYIKEVYPFFVQNKLLRLLFFSPNFLFVNLKTFFFLFCIKMGGLGVTKFLIFPTLFPFLLNIWVVNKYIRRYRCEEYNLNFHWYFDYFLLLYITTAVNTSDFWKDSTTKYFFSTEQLLVNSVINRKATLMPL